LLSYSNQPDHRYLNRYKVRDYLVNLASAKVAPATDGASYEAKYARLTGLLDPASSFERAFLDHLFANRLRLPDHAQHIPSQDIPVQPDFYYERDGIPGVCIFVDGPSHGAGGTRDRDTILREALRAARTLDDQVPDNADLFCKIR
jgi:hypothetical protein